MTYCVGLQIERGIAMLSDTQHRLGDRRFAAMSATWSKALRDGFAELPPWGGA